MTPGSDELTVLMVASSYPRFKEDTASVFLKYLAEYVSDTGVRVHVLAPSDPHISRETGGSSVKVHYFRYFPACSHMLAYGSGILPNIRRHPWLVAQIPFFLLAMFYSLMIHSLKIRPQVIHAHWIIPVGSVAVLVGKLVRVPVIVSAHGGDAFGLRSGLPNSLKKYVMKHSQAWTANTANTARAAYGDNQSVKLNIIPMGVDTNKFSSSDPPKPLGDGNPGKIPIILSVGRLVEKKGVKYLIEAVAELVNQRGINIKLWVIGDGECRDELQRLAGQLGVAPFIEFKGVIPNDELPDYYAAADLFVAPSVIDQDGDTEGQGVVIIEAMAAGVPVIASKVGGITDIINDGKNGILVEPEDTMSLANTLHDCVAGRDLSAILENAQKKVKEKYDWHVVASQFRNLYQNITT